MKVMGKIFRPGLTGFFALALFAGGAAPAHAQPSRYRYRYGPSESYAAGDATRGGALAAAKCAVCHGPDGNSALAQNPKLAGQNPNYLAAQMLAFKTGARPSAVMAPAVADLSDNAIDDLARFYSEQTIRPDPLTNREEAEAGARIFTERGGPGMPPCAMCHGDSGPYPHGMTGMRGMGGMMGDGSESPAPLLYGQHAAYTLERLDRFASEASANSVMSGIAAGLSRAERRAVAAYLASAQ